MKKTLKHQTTNEQPRSTTKKYIERLIETEEAEREIVDFLRESPDDEMQDEDSRYSS